MFYRSFSILYSLLLALAGAAHPLRGEPVQLEAKWELVPIDSKLTQGVMIRPIRPNGMAIPVETKIFDENHPGLTSPAFWRFTENDKPIKYRLVVDRHPDTGRANGIFLMVPSPPQRDRNYKVAPAPGKSVKGLLVSRLTITNAADFGTVAVDSTYIDRDLAHLKANEAVKTSVSLKTGDKNTAKLELFWGFDGSDELSDWRWKFHALAEGSYRPKESEKALSKVLGEVEWLYTRDLGFSEDPVLAAVWQIGGVARIQSDQEFENVEGSIGVSSWLALNGKAIKRTADFLCLNGPADRFAAPMLINLSYTYVQKMENNIVGKSEGFYDDTNRLNGKIYWSFALLRDLHLERISPKLDTYDLNVVINSGFAYDFRAGELFPDIEASLELTPQRDPATGLVQAGKPSFVLTYKNGKSTTRFENYDALLAGIKIPF